MKIHFLNVGHGDCTIIEFKERIMVVDINNTGSEESMDEKSKNEILHTIGSISKEDRKIIEGLRYLGYSSDKIFHKYNLKCKRRFDTTNPITYIEDNKLDDIFRFVITHPHMDHMQGLKKIKNKASNIWICDNNFTKEDFKNEEDEEDWKEYLKLKNKLNNSKENFSPKVLDIREGAEGKYYSDDNITVLSPNSELIELAEENNNPNIMSTVLLIEYNDKKIILSGDAEKDTWDYIYDNYKDDLKDIYILKAAHHGRDSGYHQEIVKVMSPEYVIVSVGKKPSTDASNKYKNYSNNVFSTRWKGNIIFDLDNADEPYTSDFE